MGFTSHDDLLNQITVNGKYLRREGAKVTTPVHTAGGWHCLAGLAGSPNSTNFPSAQDLVFQSCSELGGDGNQVIFGIQHGGNVAAATKHILNVGAGIVASAGAPWMLKLVDLQGYYRFSGANVTGTGARTLINSNTFTASSSSGLLLTYTNDFNTYSRVRFTNSGGGLPTGLAIDTDYWLVRVSATTARVATSLGNAIAGTVIAYTDGGTGTHTMMMQMPRYDGGVGCEAFFVVQTAPATGGPTLSASAYDAPGTYTGLGTRAFQGSPTFGAAADAYAARVPHSGNAAGRYLFLPRQGGDTGIARINSITLSGGTAYTGSGVLALCVARSLLDLPISVTGMWGERDLINQLPSLPRVMDGACLVWMLFGTGATTANTPLTFSLDFGWGG